MKRPNLKSYSILTAYRMPETEGNPPIPIAAGKLSKIIKLASQVSRADYYGLKIDYGGGVLNESDIQAIITEVTN